MSESSRPRRQARLSARALAAAEQPPELPVTRNSKRTAKSKATSATAQAGTAAPAPQDAAEDLRILLNEPKSELTRLNMSDIVNAKVWQMLSPAARERLALLLPRSAALNFKPELDASHPALQASQDSGSTSAHAPSGGPSLMPSASRPACSSPSDRGGQSRDIDPTHFTDPHFLAAMRTFQDHLFTGWLAPSHARVLAEFEEGVRAGTLHAAWKDEAWDTTELGVAAEEATAGDQGATTVASPAAPRKQPQSGSAGLREWKLADLARRAALQEGDVLAYKRHFAALNVTVEKDALIERIHPKTRALKLVMLPGAAGALPPELVRAEPTPATVDLFQLDANSAAQLDTGVLDADGRVPRGARPHGNAWKYVTVWRWRGAVPDGGGVADANARGGRESFGTLHYLRSALLQER
ncbi:hypothetical protein BC834DRAFT_238456 [Gloeopeniophorella convolvens]|nr:hypothetical protein BC834DRAFT_238456 [Gloeopeniophorella convolvens]